MIGSLFTLAAVLKFAHAAFMGTPNPRSESAREAPVAMLIPMGVLSLGSLALGLFPGLALVPIAAIMSDLGMTPIAATLTGPLPGLDGWSPMLLSVLVLVFGLILLPWLRLGRKAGVVRSNAHVCGVGDLSDGQTRLGANSLFETPDKAIHGLLPKGIGSGTQA
jgi:NADH:ubiquinone oxidoreductase subunit 5 (subunit L)/multisubunit Na+/H+ antiporter MnhA subunit